MNRYRALPKHRKVQHTVTFGSLVQAIASLMASEPTLAAVLAVGVGLVITLIWVWAE
jgi:uncharacterized membrane protein